MESSSCRLQLDYDRLLRLASHRCVATLCTDHCSTCVAPGRKGHDDLTSSPPSSSLSPAESLKFPSECWQVSERGFAPSRCGLNPTSHDTSLTTAMQYLYLDSRRHQSISGKFLVCQALSCKVLRVASNSPTSLRLGSTACAGPWSIHLSLVLRPYPRRSTYRVSCAISKASKAPTASRHRLRHGLPGI